MRLISYERAKKFILNGDLIAWNGKGHNTLEWFYSLGIKLLTGPITHCSTAMWAKLGNNYMLQVWESAAQGQVFDSLDRRIARAAKEGWTHCWWFPLKRSRRMQLNQDAMITYAVRKVEEGTPYDVKQAIRSAFDRRERQRNKPNDSALFCSESHMFALLEGGAIKDCNPSEAHPLNVVQFDIHKPDYYQIWFKDAPLELPDVGTVPVDGWDV